MGLKRYREKRDFGKTPEPTGGKRNRQPIFVVQKHDARRLHYDFRIECEGVLKSWAVPKGFPTDHKTKRLAIQVEDHPLDYADFEGVIPKGEYGAGPVMVWDRGTYYAPGLESKPLTDKEMVGKLEKGEIVVHLSGHKLKGSYVLVRSRETQWLLFRKKDNDEEVGVWDENSVKTGRTMDEIVQGRAIRKRVDLSRLLVRFPKTTMPRSIKPMLAKSTAKIPEGKDWAYEIKWDGYRVVSFVRGKKVVLKSRNEIDYSEAFNPIMKSLETLGHECILDGEVVVLDQDGKPSFQMLQNYLKTGEGELVYYVFDILHLDGHDLTQAGYSDRRAVLEKVVSGDERIRLSLTFGGDGEKFFNKAIQQGLEGMMAKKVDSSYIPDTRTDSWLKIKAKKTEDLVIVGWNFLKGKSSGFGALHLGRYEDGVLKYAGKVGSGVDDKMVSDRLDAFAEAKSPFKERVADKSVNWVRPELVCTVEFTEKTDDGKLRHPVFLALRDDVTAGDLVRESLSGADVAPKRKFSRQAPRGAGRSQIFKQGKVEFELTHLDRIFWPEDGLTKQDLVEYYRKISSFILPHLKDRPMSLNRYPHGLSESSFYQKNNPELPEWATAIDLDSESRGETIRYVYCNSLPMLIYLVQLGCIEMNVWNSRRQKPDFPDYMVMDLDPEGIGFGAVVELALKIKEIFDKIGAKSFCKTSGATGLHVYVPLGARYTHEQARLFSEAIMNTVYPVSSDIASLERNPEKRQGKVYLDFLQNRRGQTMAAPYCVRPRPGATVSMPLDWKEVNGKLNPKRFNIRTATDRMVKGDLWKPVLGKGIDMESCLRNLRRTGSRKGSS